MANKTVTIKSSASSLRRQAGMEEFECTNRPGMNVTSALMVFCRRE